MGDLDLVAQDIQPFGGFGISSGQPSKVRIQEIAPNVAKVVSFRGTDENKDFDEAAVVAEAGGAAPAVVTFTG